MIRDAIRERGPLTVAAFMELALYDPQSGYYARAAQRSGRAGDFFTSVDVGAMFGRLLAAQIGEMAAVLQQPGDRGAAFDLVEAGAGNGRLAADILLALRDLTPTLYGRTDLHLIEASPAARAAQRHTLGPLVERLASSTPHLPTHFAGVLVANELLDAMPVHQVVMRDEGLREVYVTATPSGIGTCEGPPSTPALAAYLTRVGAALEPGWRAEIGLQALDWVRDAARRLARGFLILIDYGHDAGELYSVTHSAGTLTSFSRHTMAGPERGAAAPPWLERPGEQDLTAHVDFTGIRQAAAAEGATVLGFLDQTYFLMGILQAAEAATLDSLSMKDRLALKTLLMPGGLGSTLKVLILGKGVGTPALRGCSYRMRVT